MCYGDLKKLHFSAVRDPNHQTSYIRSTYHLYVILIYESWWLVSYITEKCSFLGYHNKVFCLDCFVSLIYLYWHSRDDIYRGADKSLARPTSRCVLFDGENISFDASLVIYINSTNIPPIMIINKIYEHQNLLSV